LLKLIYPKLSIIGAYGNLTQVPKTELPLWSCNHSKVVRPEKGLVKGDFYRKLDKIEKFHFSCSPSPGGDHAAQRSSGVFANGLGDEVSRGNILPMQFT
jgi:hypothetical protein